MEILEVKDLIIDMSKLNLVLVNSCDEVFEMSIDLGEDKKLNFTYCPMSDYFIIIVEESNDELTPIQVDYVN